MSKKIFRLVIFIVLMILISGIFYVVNAKKKVDLTQEKKVDFIQIKNETVSSPETVSFIVPHHLVAEKLIDRTFAEVKKKNRQINIKRVILISPNHFYLGNGWVIGSDKNWETKNGNIEADKSGLDELKKNNNIYIENNAFQKEHGIENILPYIAKYFPDSKVIPLMVKDGFPLKKAHEIAEILARNFSDNTLLILSSDFSHELEENISEFHDRKAIEVIKNLNYSKVYALDTDCAAGLAIIMKYSEILGYGSFNVLENSSSSKIGGKNFIGENTSYITGYFSKKENISQAENVHLMFFGDLVLDRYNQELMNKQGVTWLTEKVRRLFWSQDENIVNLEGPITNNQSVSIGTKETEKNHFIFTFNPEKTKDFLNSNRISLVNIGNNHILNFGEIGLIETKKNLENFGVGYFGDPSQENNFLIKNINGQKIAFVNFNQFSGLSEEKTIENIKATKKHSDFVVIYAHWGIEYQLKENEKQKKLARRFIDNGADLVVGSHPHVVQPIEIYKNKAIFYSLGNFVFDQYFSEDVKNRLALAVAISKEKTEFVLEPLYVQANGQIGLSDETKRKELLSRIAEDSAVSAEIKKAIKIGYFSIENN